MRLRNKKNATLRDVILQKVIIELIVVVIMVVVYVGYTLIDDIFINRAAEKQKKMEATMSAITTHGNEIAEYKKLWRKMLETGEDKRVVFGLTFSKIEAMFKVLPRKFDIENFNITLDITDSVPILQEIKLGKLPLNVNMVAYRFSIKGDFEVETDLYNMIVFMSKNFPGVMMVKSLSVDSKVIPKSINDMTGVKSLAVDISGDWFFLSAD